MYKIQSRDLKPWKRVKSFIKLKSGLTKLKFWFSIKNKW